MTDTEAMLQRAAAMGMEVSEEQYAYREEVRPQLIKVRTQTHLGNPAAVVQAVDEAIKTAAASEASANATLAEAQARRRNLLLPLGLIVLVMVLLYAKLRQLPGSPGYAGAVTMRDSIDRLKHVMTDTETMLQRAAAMGMEVSEEQYAYREEVRPQLVKLRTQTHLGNPAAVVQAVDEAIKTAGASEASANATLAEAQARRRNLLLPLGLIVLVMVLLYAKLRQLERRG